MQVAVCVKNSEWVHTTLGSKIRSLFQDLCWNHCSSAKDNVLNCRCIHESKIGIAEVCHPLPTYAQGRSSTAVGHAQMEFDIRKAPAWQALAVFPDKPTAIVCNQTYLNVYTTLHAT